MIYTKEYYLPAEISEKFRISISYVYFLLRRKEIQATKIGRVYRIPRAEYCLHFCKGTGICVDCEKRKGTIANDI
jgi:excisionase family DNA binding protein